MTPAPAANRGFVLSLASPSQTPCGVEMFARGLSRAAGGLGLDSRSLAVAGRWGDTPALWRALAGAGALVVNLPVVAWKRTLLTPLLALLIARLRGARTVVVLHEWADLHPLRRASVSAYLLLAQIVLFSSPTVREEFLSSPFRRLPFASALAPIPPNIAPPSARLRTPAVARIEAQRAKGSLVLGHFGSIYPKKRSTFVLDVAHALQAMNRRVFVVFIGDFVKANDDIETRFFARARELGLEDSVMVSGYIQTEAEIFALFDAVDVFVYSFAEGLTARRSSVLTCLESGRPIVVNAAKRQSEFDHHPSFRRLIAQGALRLVPTDAAPADFARAIDAISAEPRAAAPDIFAPAWRDAALALRAALQ
jgi:glycosyltransferase involved in cell wall biosynthesis